MKDIYHLASTVADPDTGVITTSTAFFDPATAPAGSDVGSLLQQLCDSDDPRWNTNEAPGTLSLDDDAVETVQFEDFMNAIMNLGANEGQDILEDNLQDA